MLKLKFREEEAVHPLQALLPWIDFITPDIVLNKDGSLLAAFRYTGVDPDNLTVFKVDSLTDRLENACRVFDDRVTAWWIVDKKKDFTYSGGQFLNPTAAALDAEYSRVFRSGQRYTIDFTLYLLYTGETGAHKFFDRVSRIQAEGKSITASVLGAAKESLSGKTAFARDTRLLASNIQVFERLISAFASAAPLSLKRLSKGAGGFERALATLVNRANPPASHEKPDFSMLDSWAPSNYVQCDAETMRFTGNERDVYAAALGVTKWPEHTSPMLFETLSMLDMEITLCQVVRFMNSEQSRKAINEMLEYYTLTQYSMIGHALAKAASKEPEKKAGMSDLLEECKESLRQINSENLLFTQHNLTIFAYGDDPQHLKRNVSAISERLGARQFNAVRERLNMLPSFCAMMPGQWAMQTRYDLLSLSNVADCAPIYTIGEGRRLHDYFSRVVFQREVPAVAMFSNSYGGRVYFSSHVGQVGHMAIIAPTGGGKTTFVNFVLSQFQRYGKVNTIIFDRNYSCRIVTELHDGTHIDLKGGAVRFNPFFAMMDGTPDGKLWVRDFILRRLAEGGYVSNAEDRLAIDQALDLLASHHEHTGQPLRMSALATFLPKRLEIELGEWLEGRPFGMFDCETDDFSLCAWTTIEMKEILANERIGRAFIDYALRKIYTTLDGTPTFIYIEEASFLLNNPIYKDLIDDCLKTFRKLNAFLWLTMQSPESISNEEMAATILDNIFSFLMLYNEKVEPHRELYKKSFGLQEHHVDLIARLKPKREYLLVQTSEDGSGSVPRVICSEFTPAVLAYLRSESSVQNVFDKHKASGLPDWKQRYLREVELMG